MPKRMIVYASKTGTTKDCALELQSYLGQADMYDLRHGIPYVTDDYDTVILGSSIRMGNIQRRAKKFIVQNKVALFRVDLGLFICNGAIDSSDDLFEANIPPGLLRHASVISSFGGDCSLEKQRGLSRLILKKFMTAASQIKGFKEPHVMHGVIRRFAQEIEKTEEKSARRARQGKTRPIY